MHVLKKVPRVSASSRSSEKVFLYVVVSLSH